ncbi:hypothetical protein [Thauera butanivorans]|uniref:hypothetical protein n=1 Tax=Thauera butanivorans TaxID=86174 RepID=UPI0008380C3D|nr:hypothetical protein [Thauera butanivorans]
MSVSWQFFADAGKTVPLATLSVAVSTFGGVQEGVVYFGSNAAGRQLQAASDPGSDPIEIWAHDTDPEAGLTAGAVKLALSAGGLDGASAGDPITVGTTISSTTVIAVHYRITVAAMAEAVYSDVQLRTSSVIELDA